MTRFLRVACLPIAWLSALGAGAQEWIATEVRGGMLTFPAVVEGVETTAALNTGAALDSIDAAFAQRIGLTLSGRRQRVTSAYSASRSVASESQLDVELFGGKTVLHDTRRRFTTPIRRCFSAQAFSSAPCIACDVLRHFVVSIDLKRELMQIERPEKASAESQGDSANP